MAEYEEFISAPVGRPNARIVIRFDKRLGTPERFVVQLQELIEPVQLENWRTVAQIDHAPTDEAGHDLYAEGLHVDIYRSPASDTKVWPSHSKLPQSPGALIRGCTQYLQDHHDWFFDVSAGEIDPVEPPDFEE